MANFFILRAQGINEPPWKCGEDAKRSQCITENVLIKCLQGFMQDILIGREEVVITLKKQVRLKQEEDE